MSRQNEFATGASFLERRHAQLMTGFNQQAEKQVHATVDRYHEAGHHDWTVEKQWALNTADPDHENDPYDTVPKRGVTPKHKCTWCRNRKL